jgi:hypothetical protein
MIAVLGSGTALSAARCAQTAIMDPFVHVGYAMTALQYRFRTIRAAQGVGVDVALVVPKALNLASRRRPRRTVVTNEGLMPPPTGVIGERRTGPGLAVKHGRRCS